MLFCCFTSMINSMSWCHVTARQLYNLSCTKDLRSVQQSGRASSIGLYNSSKTPKLSLSQVVGALKTVQWAIIAWYQRPGFKQWYICADTVRRLFRLQCSKHLVSSQSFDVGLLWANCTAFLYQSPGLAQAILLFIMQNRLSYILNQISYIRRSNSPCSMHIA